MRQLSADRDVGFEAVPLDYVLSAVEAPASCASWCSMPAATIPLRTRCAAPWGRRPGDRPRARLGRAETGTLVVYAAKHGETALDGDGIGNSPFASAFIKNVQTPGLEVRRMFDVVRDDVGWFFFFFFFYMTRRRQQPFTYGLGVRAAGVLLRGGEGGGRSNRTRSPSGGERFGDACEALIAWTCRRLRGPSENPGLSENSRKSTFHDVEISGRCVRGTQPGRGAV